MTYLYLLPFKDKKYFKLGISKNLDIRVKNHYNTYDLDLDNSLIVSAKKSVFIKSLEQELLLKLDKTDFTTLCDGYTEIRYMQDFEKALDYIKSKDDFFGFQIEKYNIIIKPKPDENLIKHMNTLIGISKRVKLTNTQMANRLNISENEYILIKEMGCENNIKKDIINILVDECENKVGVWNQNDIRYKLIKVLEDINRVY